MLLFYFLDIVCLEDIFFFKLFILFDCSCIVEFRKGILVRGIN